MVRPPSAFVGWTKIDKSDELLDCENTSWEAIAANRICGVRATLVHALFTARQGVEDDDKPFEQLLASLEKKRGEAERQRGDHQVGCQAFERASRIE